VPRTSSDPECPHVDMVRPVAPLSRGCDRCLAAGDTWVHLRACVSCGRVGCCDESKNRHATKHYHETGHPLVQSLEPGDDWLYCYVDEVLMPLV
jgi:uncharacterized UBP type Zn finger protein